MLVQEMLEQVQTKLEEAQVVLATHDAADESGQSVHVAGEIALRLCRIELLKCVF